MVFWRDGIPKMIVARMVIKATAPPIVAAILALKIFK
jgi:hypothetical protein